MSDDNTERKKDNSNILVLILFILNVIVLANTNREDFIKVFESNKKKGNPSNISLISSIQKISKKRYPAIKIIDKLINNDSLFETIIVSANDNLVNKFLKNEIKFTDISKKLLKFTSLNEFKKFKKIKPVNVKQIEQLADYVSLKINTTSV